MIEVSGLGVRFGSGTRQVHAVRDVSFGVAEGETYGLVGESGSGKSTVLKCVAGLIEGFEGEVRLGGRAVAARRARDQRRAVQMVFQDPYGSLHPRHTVDRVLTEPCIIHGFSGREQRIERVLADVGLGPAFRYRYPHQLSGGQRQRVSIARALILEPRVLLLDEPTSALDVSVQAEILNLLRRLRAGHGLTMLLVSHDLAVIAYMCDRLAVMRQGEVLETLDSRRLRAAEPTHPYTRQLVRASEGYDRGFVEEVDETPA